MIYSYSTLAGARKKRREIGGCIIRILAAPDDLFVVVPSFLQTQIMSVDEDGKCDGSISLVDLTARADDTTLRAQNEALAKAASIAAEELECFVDFAVRQCEFEGDEVAGYEAVNALRNALAQVVK